MNTKELNKKLEKIKLLVMDVDGTLTDGSMYYGEKGEELKRFFVKDGMGIVLLKKAGIKTAILTSESSKISISRAQKLEIDYVLTGSNNKSQALENLAKELSLELNEIAFAGDDVNDLHAINVAGFSGCPADSADIILENVDFISKYDGGRGAIREISEIILKAQNKSIILFVNW
jgi:YrbI family 3-deoxy-D-manno-octulosonate 8-phosphate phosphatase